MNVIQTTGTTGSDGTLILTLPLGKPGTRFEIAVVAQPEVASTPQVIPPADPWAEINAFRERLAASGRNFDDSTEYIREDRDNR
jgi:hypothetical protein